MTRAEAQRTTEDEIGTTVIEPAIAVQRALGPGLLETVYEVILELQSVQRVSAAHKKHVQTDTRLTSYGLGYLLNFGEEVMRTVITRCVNGLKE